MLRSDEEIRLIDMEMRATISFYLKDWQEVTDAVKEWSVLPCSLYNTGALVALIQLARRILCNLVSSFGKFLDLRNSLPTEEFMVLPSYVHHS